MKIISQHECQEWLGANLGKDLTLENIESKYPHWISYELPTDTGVKTQLAHFMTRWAIDAGRPGLFWITAWGVWPSCENPAIFYGYRKSLDEERPLIDAPGHIFQPSDVEQLECLLGLSLYSYWDASLFDGLGTVVFRCSHDEWMSLHTKSAERLQELRAGLEPYKFKETGRS